MRILVPLILGSALAAAEPPALKVMPAGTIVHDLRDLMPYADPAKGKPEENLHEFSVTDGYFAGYRDQDSDHDGFLSRGDVIRIVAGLQKMLRETQPDIFAAIDTDGDDAISQAEMTAYLNRKK
jgi:hypothetical protein